MDDDGDVVDAGHDALLEFVRCHSDMAQDGAGELREEALDQVEPGAVLGRKVKSKRPGGRVSSQARVSSKCVRNDCRGSA